jgi:anti-sigma B factor antagonist
MSSDPPFRLDLMPLPGAFVIAAAGELDMATATALPEAARRMNGAKPGAPVLVDLSEVEFMDSSGLRGLLDARAVVGAAGHPFALLRPSPPVRRVLELVDLGGHMPVVDSTDPESLSALG